MKEKICPTCKKIFRKRRKYCSNECVNRSHSPEIRKKISESRKKYLAENPDKHPWKKNSKFKSEPCEFLKSYLRKMGIQFVEEWRPLNDRFFSIDIAFPDIKLGIEVNGNQHYNSDGTLKQYYKKRHDLIESSGWKLLEIHYSHCYFPESIVKLIDIKEQPDYSEYFNSLNKKKKKEKTTPKSVLKKQEYEKRCVHIRELLLASDIDFSKFGWVQEAAKIIGITPQKVSWWMRKNMSDFYESSCFKRKRSTRNDTLQK